MNKNSSIKRRRTSRPWPSVRAWIAAALLAGTLAGCAGMEHRVHVSSDPGDKPAPDFAGER